MPFHILIYYEYWHYLVRKYPKFDIFLVTLHSQIRDGHRSMSEKSYLLRAKKHPQLKNYVTIIVSIVALRSAEHSGEYNRYPQTG